jgi:hypothetical protein
MENTDKIIENAITNSVLHKANTAVMLITAG